MQIRLVFRCGLLLLGSALLAACVRDPGSVGLAASGELPRPGHLYLMVDHGQTLERIAQTYRVARQDIIAANNLTPPYALTPGVMLEIPLSSTAPTMAARPVPRQAAAPAKPRPKSKPVRTAGAAHEPAHEATPKRAAPEIIPLD